MQITAVYTGALNRKTQALFCTAHKNIVMYSCSFDGI